QKNKFLPPMLDQAEDNNCSIRRAVKDESDSIVRWTEIAASLAGSLPALAYITVLLITRAYQKFIRRLSLYIALTALLVAVTWPRWGGSGASQQLIHFQLAAQVYAGLAFGLIAILVSVYVFAIAVRKIDQNGKHEIVGLVIVFVLPALVCWIALLPICGKHLRLLVALVAAVVFVQFIVSNAALFAVLMGILKRVADRDAFNQHHYKRALKSVLPLFCYVFCMQIPATLVVASKIYVATLDDVAPVSFAAAEVIALVPCWSFVLPVLLVCDTPCRCFPNTSNENSSLNMHMYKAAFEADTSFSTEIGAPYGHVRSSD
ncbi:hypothetical protein EMCRGX_G016320, partial [Ephydatia muelleri]